MEKRCIIIDNEEQNSNVEEIQRLGRAKGLQITCEEFNVGMLEKEEFFTDHKIDIDKVVRAFNRSHKGVTYHLAAFDWDLGEEEVNGVELIRKFRDNKILVNTPKILYSGLLKDKISEQLDKFKRDALTKDILIGWINTLVRSGVKNYVDRTSYEQEVINQLSKTDETLDLIIEEELKKFPELRFNSGFTSKSFAGRTFLEVAGALENDDMIRNEFKREIIEQVLAYLTEQIGSE